MEPKTDIKTIGIGAVAIAALAIAIAKPTTKEFVAASASADDVEVASIVQASPTLKTATCKLQSHVINVKTGPEMLWVCDDVGYDPGRQAMLSKRAGPGGNLVQYDPTETDDGVTVAIRVGKGEPTVLPWTPYTPPVVVEEVPVKEVPIKELGPKVPR